MNPYAPPDRDSDVADGHNHESPLKPVDHPLYDLVLRMVLWGEERDEVYRRLEVNGVYGEVADRLYEQARADRIRTIRSDYTRKLLIGVVLILAAATAFSVCWYGLGFIPRILLYGSFAALGIGSWKFIDGLSGYLMAPNKTGSVSDET